MSRKEDKSALECFHCGDHCPDDKFRAEGYHFCCHGCLTVYHVLKEGGLENYYADRTELGSSVADLKEETYAYLDEDSIQEKLLLFQDGQQAKVRLHLPSIHCSSCLWLLEHLYRLEPKVLAVKVDFAKRKALISYSLEGFGLRNLAELLHRIGYPPHISLEAEEEGKDPVQKSLIIKIGVTGFLFGNIMLLSFPEYLSTGQDLIERYERFFSYLILGMSLPVLLYGARDYFSSSILALKQKRLVIDVPISLGILAIFARSVYEIFTGIGPGYFDSMAGLVFFLLIGKWYQARVYDRLSFDRDFSSYFPLSVLRLEGEEERNVPVMDLEEGNRIRVLHQGILPADAILQSKGAEMDYSFVTGESRAVHLEQGQLLYAGAKNVGPSVLLEVRKPVSQSYLTDLWNRPLFQKENSNLSGILDRAAAKFTVAILGISFFTALYWAWHDPSIMWQAVTAVLIVACPCALALSVPFSLGTLRREFGKAGLFSRSTDVLEEMSTIEVLVLDKTGTLTKRDEAATQYQGQELTESEGRMVKSLARQSDHPHSRAITAMLEGQTLAVQGFEEQTGAGISAEVDGHKVKLGSAKFLGLEKGTYTQASQSFLSIDGQYKGRFIMHRQLREGVGELLQRLGKNYRLILLSGDNSSEAHLFSQYFEKGDMHFNMLPAQKMDFVANVQEQGVKVMMLGDGLNDAGALKQSDVGIAVSDDINLFSPSCDAILQGESLHDLNGFMQSSAAGERLVKWSMLLSLMYNTVGISIAVQGLLTPLFAAILMPLSSVTIVLFASLGAKSIARKTLRLRE